MQKEIRAIPSLKKLKHSQRADSYESKSFPVIVNRIKPMPILRTDIFNNLEPKQRLALRGYKYFSKLSASGEFTLEKLREIKNASSLKLVKRFEFDPYFSKYSCIKDLLLVFKKLKMTTNLNLVIRRVEMFNEPTLLMPYLPRLPKMRSFRIEFSRNNHVNADTIEALGKTLTKCVMLESLTISSVFLPLLPNNGMAPIICRLYRFRKLKEASFTNLCCSNAKPIDECRFRTKLPPMKNLRSLRVKKGFKSGWIERSEEDEEILPYRLPLLGCAVNLEDFTFQFEMYYMTQEILRILTNLLLQYQSLKSVTLEFLGCKLDELEFLVLLQGIQKCTQIKRLTLNFIQRPNVNEDHLIFFIHGIFSLENLEQFDIYFRGTELSNVERVIDEFSKIEDIKYSFTKNSVYLHREKQRFFLFE